MINLSRIPGKFLGAFALTSALTVGSAQADVIPFTVFQGDAGDFTGELEFNLIGGTFETTIRNTSASGMSTIMDIYFETPAAVALANPTWTNTDVPGNTEEDIVFSIGTVGNAEPPGTGGVNPNLNDQWMGTDFWFSANPPPARKGLVPGQELTITWDALGVAEGFRVALHVGDCLGNESCTAITGLGLDGGVPPEAVVPIPAAAWLFGSALLGLVGVARRKKV